MTTPRYASLIICTTPRSGSTLLCKLLAATGMAGKPESWFHSPSLSDWLDYHNLSTDDFPTSEDALRAVFDATRDKGANGTGVFGLRLQGGSFDYFIEQTARLFPDHPSDKERIEAAFGPTLFLHLTRADKLSQAISRLRAEQSGLWHRAVSGEELERLSPPADPIYDPDAIARHIDELTALDTAWEEWFHREGIRPLRIPYDVLAQEPQRVLRLIVDCLWRGCRDLAPVPIPTAKLADGINRDWARRFLQENRSL